MFRYLLFPVLNALGSVLAAFAALMLVPAPTAGQKAMGQFGIFFTPSESPLPQEQSFLSHACLFDEN